MAEPIVLELVAKVEHASGMGPWIDLYLRSRNEGHEYAIASIPLNWVERDKNKERVVTRVIASYLEKVFRDA